MREKNREIDGPDPSFAFKRNGADLIVIDEIRNQKKGRAYNGGECTRTVRINVSGFYKVVSSQEENGAEGVQCGIYRW